MRTRITKKLFLAVFVLFGMALSAMGKDRVILLNTNDKKYTQLAVVAHELLGKTVGMYGQTTNGSQWIFNIPDSIAQKAMVYGFGYYPPNANKTEQWRDLSFLGVIEGDTLRNHYVNFDIDSDTLRVSAIFFNTIRYDEVIGWQTDSVREGYSSFDAFIVDPESNHSLKEQMQDHCFSMFANLQHIEKTYEEYLSDYASKITANPKSVYYISNIAGTTGNYRSPDDLQMLYDLFDPEIKQSYFGQLVDEYIRSKRQFLNTRFENMSLPLCDTGVLEPIIQDSSRYNLVIFSASWCRPCIEEIPLLKEVYNDLKNTLSMTYISVDEQETLDSWKKLLQKENIPWRSLLAVDNVEGIRKKYHAQGVPYLLLVYPSQEKEVLDIRNQEDRDKLYNLVNFHLK